MHCQAIDGVLPGVRCSLTVGAHFPSVGGVGRRRSADVCDRTTAGLKRPARCCYGIKRYEFAVKPQQAATTRQRGKLVRHAMTCSVETTSCGFWAAWVCPRVAIVPRAIPIYVLRSRRLPAYAVFLHFAPWVALILYYSTGTLYPAPEGTNCKEAAYAGGLLDKEARSERRR